MLLGNPRIFAGIFVATVFPPLTGMVGGMEDREFTGPPPSGLTLIPPEKVVSFCSRPWQAADETGAISAFVAGAGAVTAPFLLFRMKRSGCSFCRAEVFPEGIGIIGRR